MGDAIRIEVDYDAGAAYIALGEDTRMVAETTSLSPTVNVDLDQFGLVVGIEVLSLHTPIPWETLVRDCHVHSSVAKRVQGIAPSIEGFLVKFQHHSAGVQDFGAQRPARVLASS